MSPLPEQVRPGPTKGASTPTPSRFAAKAVFVYVAAAAVWILASDALLDLLVADRRRIAQLSAAKGLLFVVVTGLFLFFFLRRQLRRSSLLGSDLERARALWQSVFENFQDALLLIDLDKHSFLAANAATERITGYTPEEIAGRPTRILYADPIYKLRPRMMHALATTGRFSEEIRIVRKDDVVRRIDALFLAFGSTVKPPISVAILRDITDSRLSEEALRRREAQLSAILETHADGVLYVDEGEQISFVNPAAARILGQSPDALLGAAFDDWPLFGADGTRLQAAAMPHCRARAERGTVTAQELSLRRPDGSLLPVSVSAAPIETSYPGNPGVVVTLRDITNQKEAEQAVAQSREQLRQAQKLESIGRLAGGIAHDFNNSLTAIFGYSELLGDAIEGATPELLEIRRAAEHAAALTRQLLAFSRKQVLRPRLLNANTVVADTERMISRLIGEDVALVTNLAPDLALIRADPVQLQQVLVNLAVNARDAMPRGGIVTISSRVLRVSRGQVTLPPGDYVELSISDTGVGIPPSDLELIFEPFFSTKGQEGTGLGLSTVYGIVKQSGGHVGVESEPGCGTTFRIQLPALRGVEAADGEASPPIAQRSKAEGGVILVVEDDSRIRKLARLALEQRGYAVESAASSSEALSLVARIGGELDLLLTDVILPGMSGPQLADELRRHYSGLRVVFMSGYADEVLARRGILESDTKLLEKPFTREQLWCCIEEAFLDTSTPLNPEAC